MASVPGDCLARCRGLLDAPDEPLIGNRELRSEGIHEPQGPSLCDAGLDDGGEQCLAVFDWSARQLNAHL
jgi:hypothetical protein